MHLSDLIAELKQCEPTLKSPFGFHGIPHSDRGDYANAAFEFTENVTFGEMLKTAEKALGASMTGYKGGEYTVCPYTDVYIGEDSSVCGEPISLLLLRAWHELALVGSRASDTRAKGKEAGE